MEFRVDKLAITGKKGKIICRNSYERKMVHDYAESKGLSHRSVIDYTKYHINSKTELSQKSYCCDECDTYEIKVYSTPQSWVEINNGYDEEKIGEDRNLILRRTAYGSESACKTLNELRGDIRKKLPGL
jgi:hypothetical protein